MPAPSHPLRGSPSPVATGEGWVGAGNSGWRIAMSDAKAREAICTLGASIFERGLTAGSSGNISVRVEGGWLMTPTNASLGRLDPARLSKLDDDGKLVGGDPPTKE